MQERIIEILVYLLTELQQERNRKDKVDLSRELFLQGYTEAEVNLAFSWIFRHLGKPSADQIDGAISFDEDLEELPEMDRLAISPEAYGYLLQLLHLGIIREDDMDMFIERAIAYGKDDINVDDLKSIVATILFGIDNRSSFNGYTFYDGNIPVQ